MRKINYIIAFFILLLILNGCGLFESDKGEYAATVNGEKIPLKEFQDRFRVKLDLMDRSSGLSAEELEKVRAEFLNELIDEKILLLRAKRLGLDVSREELRKKVEEIKADFPEGFDQIFQGRKAEYNAWTDELRKRMLLEKLVEKEVTSSVTISDDEILEHFNAQHSNQISGPRVRVSQIVVSDRRQAEQVMARLKSGSDFGELAKEVSSGPEASRGGDLGWFGKGVLPENFDRVIFSLKLGQISKIVETQYGYHIFKVEQKGREGKARLEDVRDEILAELKKDKEEKAYQDWLTRLRSEARIVVNEAALQKLQNS